MKFEELLMRYFYDSITFSWNREPVTYQLHYNLNDNILNEMLYCYDKKKSPDIDDKLQLIDELLLEAVSLARQAQENVYATINNDEPKSYPYYVAASIGCYGAALANGSEYTGNYGNNVDLAFLQNFHTKKYQVLKSSLSCDDFIAFETIPSKIEVEAIMKLLRTSSSSITTPNTNHNSAQLPTTWLSLACKDGLHLNDGTHLVDTLNLVDTLDPSAQFLQAIGVNCCSCAHVEQLVVLVANHILKSGISRSIVLYPNKGEVWDGKLKIWVTKSGSDNCEFQATIKRAVASVESILGKLVPMIIVGGCCRTTPRTIGLLQEVRAKRT